MPPERDHAPAAFAADIFALGATLAHAALGVDPATLVPGAGRLRTLLKSTGHRCVAQIVAAAMHADPRKRPAALELTERLAALPNPWPAPFASYPRPALRSDAKLKARRWRKITEAAVVSARFIKSRSESSAAIAPAPGPSPHAIAAGLAGNILGLAAIDYATRRSGFDHAMLAAAETLARDVKESAALGFFTGQAGIAFVLALVAQKYARNDLAAAGRRLFHAAAEDVVELDLFSGAAGVVWSGCLLASVLHTDWPLRAVEQAARRLTRSVTEKDGALVWPSAGDTVADDAATPISAPRTARPGLRCRLRFGATAPAARVHSISRERLLFVCLKAAVLPMEGRCATSWVWKEAPAAEPGATVRPAICGACCTRSAIVRHFERR
jgi:hypothetical protein